MSLIKGERMESSILILTVMAKDKPGIVKQLSDAVFAQQGNWLESSLSRLGGQFAGIVSVGLPVGKLNAFKRALAELSADGITVRIQTQEASKVEKRPTALIQLEANDRPGIIEEISSMLLGKNVNIEKIETSCVSASMAGYDLFRAEVTVSLPKRFTENRLQTLLEQLSDDVMVTIA